MIIRLLIIFLLSVCMFPLHISCQVNCVCFNETDKKIWAPLSGELFVPSSQPDPGTFFNQNWLPGDIWLDDGRIIQNEMVKYNGLLDEILWLEPATSKIILLDKKAIYRFHFHNYQGDTSLYFQKLKVKQNIFNDSVEIFTEEVFIGDLSFFILHSFYLSGNEKIEVNNRYYRKEIYREREVYYLRTSDNKILEFRRFNRRGLYAVFPDNKEYIKGYFKTNVSGAIKTRQEILRLAEFLNSIIIL